MKHNYHKTLSMFLIFILMGTLLLAGCSGNDEDTETVAVPTPSQTSNPTQENNLTTEPLSVAVVLDEVGEDDNAFNEFSLKGAREGAEKSGLDFDYIVSSDYESDILNFAAEDYDLIITVGFLLAEATANAAKAHPDTHFAIVDVDYPSYDELPNVTSLTFAEDECGYLAGVIAGCVTETNVIGSVSGMEIPTVVRFVTGFQEGALSVNPDVTALNEYIPNFDDPESGLATGESFIDQGADVIFGVGGNTGNAGLAAAFNANVMGIGVDIDQYYTLPDIAGCLITSAMKNVDTAASQAVHDFAKGDLTSGIQKATVANGGIGLAPYHDWEDSISDECKQKVEEALQELASN